MYKASKNLIYVELGYKTHKVGGGKIKRKHADKVCQTEKSDKRNGFSVVLNLILNRLTFMKSSTDFNVTVNLSEN